MPVKRNVASVGRGTSKVCELTKRPNDVADVADWGFHININMQASEEKVNGRVCRWRSFGVLV